MHAELRCTYRIQLRDTFGFADAAGLVPYLASLGVSHVYLSPIFKAAEGSEHGYDGTDPGCVEPRFGGEEGLDLLFETLRAYGMGAVLDIVPNHLSATHDNPWWWDVLENGPGSAHAAKFDIDWQADGRPQVLLPVLGDDLEKVISRGEITQMEKGGRQVFRYFDATFPMNAESLAMEGDIAALLDAQHYRLEEWRKGTARINYRRFFDVTTLVGLRVEDADVFDATHRKLMEIVAKGPVDGLRIDHPDGLRDPAGYFARLRKAFPGLWIIVEKILEPGETLPEAWPVDGTTGYDFMNRAGALFVDSKREGEFTEAYEEFTGDSTKPAEIVREVKERIAGEMFEAECGRLSRLFRKIAACRSIACTPEQAQDLLTRSLSVFPVYRNYVVPGVEVSEADRAHTKAVTDVLRATGIEGRLVELLDGLLGGTAGDDDAVDFLARFQQLTGPVMAKGLEDTVFYGYNRLISLNEVGGDPSCFGMEVERFHAETLASWPESMLATSTHDTKRSEDMRARLHVLPETGSGWHKRMAKWSAMHREQWGEVEPDPHAEQMFFQSWVGAWPIGVERMEAFMVKACREAKLRTTWTMPDEAYEKAMLNFIWAAMYDTATAGEVASFAERLSGAGNINSLSMTLLKLTCPGIPDIYQGCELWNRCLVDPDNRRPVDFGLRRKLLEELEGMTPGEIMGRESEGLPKLHVIREALALRKEQPQPFLEGEYRALRAKGEHADHIVAFSRGGRIAVVVPRLVPGLGGNWGNTAVDFCGGVWRNRLDQREHRSSAGAADLFRVFPVALLERMEISHE